MTPLNKLRHVDPTVGRLAVMHPGLGLPDKLAEIALGQIGFFAHITHQGRYDPVVPGVLGFCDHAELSHIIVLTRVPYQGKFKETVVSAESCRSCILRWLHKLGLSLRAGGVGWHKVTQDCQSVDRS